jgi:hypothetical protein
VHYNIYLLLEPYVNAGQNIIESTILRVNLRNQLQSLGYLSVSLSLSLSSCCSHLEHRSSVKRFVSLQFLNPKRAGVTLWTWDQPVARPLPVQTQNKHTQTFMPRVGFELLIPAFEESSFLKPSGHCDGPMGYNLHLFNYKK